MVEKLNFSKEKPRHEYEYFSSISERHDIFEFCKGVSTYLHDENIPNIVMIDRSPRPFWVGIDEYYKLHYKNEKRPNIYFINPKPFDTIKKVIHEDNLSTGSVLFDSLMFASTGESVLVKKAEKYDNKIKSQFEQAYKELQNNKDKPLAIFDNCLHTGGTMMPVLKFLINNGYDDLRVVIGETSNDTSDINVDKEFTDKVKHYACGAFGTAFGVKKDDENIFSAYDDEADREEVIKSRQEIRQIVRDKGL